MGVKENSPRFLKLSPEALNTLPSCLMSLNLSGLLEGRHFGLEMRCFDDAIGNKTPSFPLGNGTCAFKTCLGKSA